MLFCESATRDLIFFKFSKKSIREVLLNKMFLIRSYIRDVIINPTRTRCKIYPNLKNLLNAQNKTCLLIEYEQIIL